MRDAVLILTVACFATGIMPGQLSAGENTPAPVNPYNGLQQREEVYEFAQKPAVKKDGAAWVITFASKAACDATVSIIDKDGKVVRHLASGVLGKNAPWPFQQNSLSQKIEWDGQADMGKTAPAGCRVRVGLGLQAAFERNIGSDPYAISPTRKGTPMRILHSARDKDDNTYLLWESRCSMFGRVFDKDGNYLRTFYPPPAGELEKWSKFIHASGKKEPLVATIWGDKVPCTERYGPWAKQSNGEKTAPGVLAAFSGVPESEVKALPPDEAPAFLSRSTAPQMDEGRLGKYFVLEASLGTKYCRICVDRQTDEIYAGGASRPFFRLDGKTGELDTSWFPKGGMDKVSECSVGPDGYLYLGLGSIGYNEFVVRLDHSGKPVPFTGDGAVPLPRKGKWEGGGGLYGSLEGKGIYGGSVFPGALKDAGEIKALWTGGIGHSTTHERGLYVSPNGFIVSAVQYPCREFGEKHGDYSGMVPKPSNHEAEVYEGAFVQVWTNEGKILTANAVGNTINGHGVAMDRDGNIYTAFTSLPAGQELPDGIADRKDLSAWGGMGSIVKFPGQGGKYPVGRTASAIGGDGAIPPAPEGALAIRKGWVNGAAWMYGGLPAQATDCTCHNVRWDMDYWSRLFIPANQVCSVMVLDANGNRVARLGRYGNFDDTEADVKAGKDGLRFSWMRALAVSDKALYVVDQDNFRILKAALKYATEAEVDLP